MEVRATIMRIAITIISLTFLTACGDAITYPVELDGETAAASQLAPTPVNQIQVVSSNTVNGGNFTEIGPVKATVGKITAFHPTPTVAQAEQKLRIEAAELGANAVISASVSDVTICALSWGCRNATGTAVKFTN